MAHGDSPDSKEPFENLPKCFVFAQRNKKFDGVASQAHQGHYLFGLFWEDRNLVIFPDDPILTW